jgi:hypothetical protein
MALTKISTAMISQSAAAVDLNVDAGTFYVDTTNNRVGVGGKTDPDTPLHVIGTATATTFAGSGASLTDIPNSALTNSSITINSTAVSLGGSLTLTTANIGENTNLYYTDARADARIAAADTDDLSEGSSNLYYTDARVDARVSGGSLGNITTTGYLRGPASFVIDPASHGDDTGTVVIAGNLQVDGTTTTINSTTLTVDDKNITLASGSVNAAAADGAGFTVDIGTGTNPAITYDGTNDEWDFNKPLNVQTNLLISSSASNSIISESGAGGLFLRGSSISVQNSSNANMIEALSAGAVTLYHNGAPKIATSSSGASITGILNVTGNIVATGDIDVDGTANLDVVDIDGAVDMASALTVGGTTTLTGAVAVTPPSGTASIAFTSAGVGSEVFSINGQIPGVSNTGFAIRNVTDSRNDLTIDANGVIAAASLDISGDIDVDGTTNLDVVDIDGAVDMASTLGVTGLITGTTATFTRLDINATNTKLKGDLFANTDAAFDIGASGANRPRNLYLSNSITAADITTTGAGIFGALAVDNFTLDGTTLALSSGDLTLDAAGSIILESNDGVVKVKDGSSAYGAQIDLSDDNNVTISALIANRDIIFKGVDHDGSNGTPVTALTLDMSAAGFASFNDGITLKNDLFINNADGSATAGYLYNDSNDFVIRSYTSDKDIIFKGSDGGSLITALTLDMSAAGAATFTGTISSGAITSTGAITGGSFINTAVRYIANQIQSGYSDNSDNSDIWINYTGYQGGTTYFRDFRVGNGKQAQLFFVDGSAGNVSVTNALTVGSTISSGAITSAQLTLSRTSTDQTAGFNLTNNQNGGYGSGIVWQSKRSDSPYLLKDAAKIVVAGENAWNSDGNTASQMQFWTNKDNTLTKHMTLTKNGYLGIGTDSPPNPLSVRKTTTAYEDVISIIGQNSPTDIMGALAYDQSTDLMIIRNDQTYATGGIAFRAGGTADHLFIKTGGNVGIGTDSPDGKFVVSNGGAEGIEFFPRASAGVNSTQHYNRSGSAYVKNRTIALNHEWVNGATDPAMNLIPDGDSTFLIVKAKAGTFNSTANLSLYGTNPNINGGSLVSRATIQAQTDGTAFGTKLSFFTNNTSNVETKAVTIDAAQNVGIGTTTPGEKLEVNGVLQIKRVGDHPAIRFVEDTTTRGYIGSGDWAINGLADADLGISSVGALALGHSGGVERMRIHTNGNVGIGTDSPDYKLHVAGTIGVQVGNAKATIDTDTTGTLNLTANQNVVNAASEINFKAPLSTGSGTIGTWARIKSGELQHAGRRQYDGVNLAGGALYRENFFRYTSYASATHVHLKTDIPWGTTTQMYSVKFTGYAYSEALAVETNLVFYNYPPSSAPISIGSTGTHSATVYESSDNKIVMRITVNTYYISFTASQYVTAQELVDFNITAVAANSSATHYA